MAHQGPSSDDIEWIPLDDLHFRDLTIPVEEAKKIRVDGSELHRLFSAILANLDDRELWDVILSMLDLPPYQADPFEYVKASTLAKLLTIPEAREFTEQIETVVRLLSSFEVALGDESVRRCEEEWKRRGREVGESFGGQHAQEP